MSDVEHMQTSLYLMDVVVLRNEGDTVYFLGLWDPLEKQALRGKKRNRARRSFVESLRDGTLESDCESGQTLHSDGARVSNSFARSRLLQLVAQRSANSSSWHHGEQTCISPFNTYPHKCLILQENANAQCNSCFVFSKVHTAPVVVPNHTCQFKKELLNLLVAVTSSTRQSATGYLFLVYKES